MNFSEAFGKVVAHEGEYTDHPTDPGNWTGGRPGSGELWGTKFGISAASYPHIDIRNLTIDQARMIYRRDYWDRLRLDDLPPEIAFDLFDTAINSGLLRAALILQDVVGTHQDGIIGPITTAAARAASSRHGPHYLPRMFNAKRLLFLASLSIWGAFGRGWARRVAQNLLM